MIAAVFVTAMLQLAGGAEAAAPDSSVAAVDMSSPRDMALTALGAGIGFGVASVVAFTTGLDAERALVAGKHTEAEADDLLNRRTIAAWVAWPTAVVAVAGVSTGITWLVIDSEAAKAGAP